jgi:hypothetical protein
LPELALLATPAPALARLFSTAAYREHAQDHAMYGPVSAPANGGGRLYLKFAVVAVAVVIASSALDKPGNVALSCWLYALAAGIVAYTVAIKVLYHGFRERNPVTQQVAAMAIYHAMFPLFLLWVLAGAFLVFRPSSQSSGLISLFSFYLIVVCLFYLALLSAFLLIATIFRLWASRSSAVQGISNLCHNRPFHAAPKETLTGLAHVTYAGGESSQSGDSDDGAACAICLEAYEDGQHLVQLPCDPPTYHAFHAPCIAQWLSRSSSCPLCKRSVVR